MELIVNHVSYTYGEKTALETTALNDVSFTVRDGEFIGIIGHTGCGKSTLLQHLNGLIKPTSGGIYLDGEDVNDKDYDRKKLRSTVGLVFQYPEHQLFEVDAYTDVCFGPKNLGLSEKEAGLLAYSSLKAVGLKNESFYVSPFDLSGGEKRRVAIAGVLAMEPKLLILDEPTAGLDPKGREEILTLIKDIQKEKNIAVILVSHSMEDVAEYADRIIVMDKGSILFDDIPTNVFKNREKLESIGLTVPTSKRIVDELRNRGINLNENTITNEDCVEEILSYFQNGY